MDSNYVIECIFCKKKLVNIIVRADKMTKVLVESNCPFCDGKSKTQEFVGKLWFGPIGKDESVNPTSIDSIDFESGKYIIKVNKVV